MTAAATGYEATFYNPAGLTLNGRRELSFGYFRILSNLEIKTARGTLDHTLEDPDVFLIGVVAPAGRLAFGFASYVLPTTLLHVVAPAPEQPFFPYWSNRTQRLLLLPGLAARPFDWLSIGVSVNFFAGLAGSANASVGPTREVEAGVSEELPTKAAPHVGLRIDPLPELAFGAVYRHAFSVPYATSTRNVIAGAPLDIGVDAEALQSPHEIAVGTRLKLGKIELTFDGTYLLWSEERGSFVRVRALVSGVRIDRPPPEAQYRDVFNLRLGAAIEHRVDRTLTVHWRAGQFYEPSFVLDQPGRSNLLDGPKLGWSLGTGLELRPSGIRIDLHTQLVNMLSRRHDKVVSSIEQAREDPGALADENGAPGVQITNAGYPFISGSGRVLTLGATLTLEVDP